MLEGIINPPLRLVDSRQQEITVIAKGRRTLHFCVMYDLDSLLGSKIRFNSKTTQGLPIEQHSFYFLEFVLLYSKVGQCLVGLTQRQVIVSPYQGNLPPQQMHKCQTSRAVALDNALKFKK